MENNDSSSSFYSAMERLKMDFQKSDAQYIRAPSLKRGKSDNGLNERVSNDIYQILYRTNQTFYFAFKKRCHSTFCYFCFVSITDLVWFIKLFSKINVFATHKLIIIDSDQMFINWKIKKKTFLKRKRMG